MKVSPKAAVAGSVVAIAAAAFFLMRQSDERRVALPHEEYLCGDPACGHVWTQELTNTPVCPECGSDGAKQARFTCPRCDHTFTAWYTRQAGVGRHEVMLPGTTQWLSQAPRGLRCPECGLTGPLVQGPFIPRPYVDSPAEAGGI